MPNGAIDHGQVHGLLDGFFDAHPLRMPYFGKSQASSCVRFEDVYPTLLYSIPHATLCQTDAIHTLH